MSIFTKKPPNKPDSDRCSACGGLGFVTRPEMKMVPQFGLTTEYYTDAQGRRQMRTVPKHGSIARTELVRKPCIQCGGSGRR